MAHQLGTPLQEMVSHVATIRQKRQEGRFHGATLYWPETGVEYMVTSRSGPDTTTQIEVRITRHDAPSANQDFDGPAIVEAVGGRDLAITNNKYATFVISI